jgi:hypothetical protein
LKYLTSERLGFDIPNSSPHSDLYKKNEKIREEKLKESKKKWQLYFIENGGKNQVIKYNSSLKEIIRNFGIPPKFRPKGEKFSFF